MGGDITRLIPDGTGFGDCGKLIMDGDITTPDGTSFGECGKLRTFMLRGAIEHIVTIGKYGALVTVAVLAVLGLVSGHQFRGGLPPSFIDNVPTHDVQKLINAHVLIMLIGFILVPIAGFTYMHFRVYGSSSMSRKRKQMETKAVQMTIQTAAFLLACIGVLAIVKHRNITQHDDNYSFHSWIGAGALALLFIQWVTGFVTRCPCVFIDDISITPMGATILLWHVFVGSTTYLLIIAAAITGFMENVPFLRTFDGKYSLPWNIRFISN